MIGRQIYRFETKTITELLKSRQKFRISGRAFLRLIPLVIFFIVNRDDEVLFGIS